MNEAIKLVNDAINSGAQILIELNGIPEELAGVSLELWYITKSGKHVLGEFDAEWNSIKKQAGIK